jgi:hypothetical protein
MPAAFLFLPKWQKTTSPHPAERERIIRLPSNTFLSFSYGEPYNKIFTCMQANSQDSRAEGGAGSQVVVNLA